MALRFRLLPLYHALAFLSITPGCFALSTNFLIQPNGALPTTVPAGGSVIANFNVTNLTSTPRNGYKVQGFPSTVTQVSSPGNCSSPINLAGHASCNLQLNVTGEVNSFFAICKGSSCTTSASPLIVSVSQTPASFIMFASGTYNDPDLDQLPLLVKNNNGALSYPTTILSNLPTSPAYNTPYLYSVSCSGNICIAAGNDSFNNTNPLVAFSTDSGTTWTYPVGSTGSWPTDFAGPGNFASTSCSSNLCIAAGNYTDTNTAFPHPFLSQYSNGSWSFPITAQNPPPGFDLFGAFNGASCNGSICIAVGSYENISSTSFPLVAQTTDGGNTWNYVVDNSTTLPNNFNDLGVLNSASCFGNICIAGGSYEDTINATHYPLLAQSTNGGQTWSYAIDDTVGPQLPSLLIPFQPTLFNSTSCSATICIAAGNYFNNDATTQFGLLAQSTNGGASWTYAISTLPQQPADFASSAQFNSASCHDSTCIAAGFYTNQSGNQVGMIAQTTNGGSTWTYVIDGTHGPQPPDYTSSAQFNSTSCENNVCIAVGSYMVGQATYPMYAQSTNGGAWTYVIDDNPATLPPNFNNHGIFNGAGGIGATTLNSKHKTAKHIRKK